MSKRNKPKILRVSYTLLSLWEKGRINEAISYYLKKPLPTTPAIDEGKRYDLKWQDDIRKTKTLVVGQTTIKFSHPQMQVKIESEYLDRFVIVGVYDCLDNDVLWEFKTGGSSSMEYANGYQVAIYLFLAELKKIPIQTSRILRYNQKEDKTDITIIHNTTHERGRGENYIQSLSYDIWDYFNTKGILKSP